MHKKSHSHVISRLLDGGGSPIFIHVPVQGGGRVGGVLYCLRNDGGVMIGVVRCRGASVA